MNGIAVVLAHGKVANEKEGIDNQCFDTARAL